MEIIRRRFTERFEGDPPRGDKIKNWELTGSIMDKSRSGRHKERSAFIHVVEESVYEACCSS